VDVDHLQLVGRYLNRFAVVMRLDETDGVFVPAPAEAACDAPPAFLPARPINQADLAALTERVRRRVIRWFRLARLLDAAAAADMLAWVNSGFSVDASVRITLIDRDVPSYFRSLEHLLRYCARPPFALERLSVIRGVDGRITRVRYLLPRHKAANWVGRGRGRKSTPPGANGVIELSPFEFLDRLADLVPPPRKHRHRYHGAFAPNHKLRRAVTALAIGNVGKRREAVTGGHAGEVCCDPHQKPRSHDTSRIAWAKLLARVGEEFPLLCPACGGDVRLISFITEPGPIRKILTHLGEPLEPPPVSPARGPPTAWGELVQVHDDRDVLQSSPDELPAIDIHSLGGRRRQPAVARMRRRSAPSVKKDHSGGYRGVGIPATTGPAPTCRRPARARSRLTDRERVAEVPLTGLTFARVKSVPHASGRTARASASLSCPWPAHRLGRARPGPLSTGRFFRRHPSSCPTSTSTASDGIPCHGADGPREERFQGRSAPTRKTRP
jgi:hypothetical protein